MTSTLVSALAARAQEHPDKRVLTFVRQGQPDSTVSLGDLHQRALLRAAALRDSFEPEQLVVLAFPPSLDLVVTFWAVLARGGVATVAPHPRAGVLDSAYWQRTQQFADDAAAALMVANTAPPDAHSGRCRVLGLSELREGPAAGAAQVVPVAEDAPAYVQFSSGTMGPPRGAVLSHRAVLAAVAGMVEQFAWTRDDVNVGWLPLSHDMGLVTQMLLPILTGSAAVVLDPADWVRTPALLFQAVSTYGGTMTWMPNFAFALSTQAVRNEQLEGVDLSSWRIVGNGAELIEADVIHGFAIRFASHGLRQGALVSGYGMAENVVGASTTRPGRGLATDWVNLPRLLGDGVAEPAEPGSAGARAIANCGGPLPGTELSIIDKHGTHLPERRVGQIVVRGSSLFSGYHRAAQQSEAAMRDGWYQTGDLGYLAGGELHPLERLDDMIVVGGRNVRPHDVEALARSSVGGQRPLVAFGVRDRHKGSQRLVVVSEWEGEPEERDAAGRRVRRALIEALDMTATVQFVEPRWISRTTSGKVSRRLTRERYLGAFG